MSEPAAAKQLGEAARRRELRYFMAAKIGVSLQLALLQFVRVQTALGNVLPAWVANLPWAATSLLLVVFAAYVAQGAREKMRGL